MRVLVTGGAGYIGSHTTDLLIADGHEVVIFDNLSTGHRDALHPQATFFQGDLRDKAAVQTAFEQHAPFDGIMHFASYILVGESVTNPWKYLRDNVLAASNLLEVATAHDVKRFILSSTANLFDDPQRMPIDENEAIIPGSPYGESKYIIERYLHWMEQVHGLAYCTLRYFNAAGAHPRGHIGEDHAPETHLIPIVLQVALGQRERVTIFGNDYDTPDGTCVRDYIHVLDLATAHILALKALADGRSRKYNLGNGKGYSVKQVVDIARSVTGQPIEAVMGERRAGDLATLIADSTTASEELGWEPKYASLEDIIATAWAWHQSHPDGYAE